MTGVSEADARRGRFMKVQAGAWSDVLTLLETLRDAFLMLRRRRTVTVIGAYNETPHLILRLKGYVYDHRYEPRMKTDLTRRCEQEFSRLGLLEGWKALGG